MKIRASTMLRSLVPLPPPQLGSAVYLAPYLIISRVGLSVRVWHNHSPSQKSPWFRRPIIAAIHRLLPHQKRALPFLTPESRRFEQCLLYIHIHLKPGILAEKNLELLLKPTTAKYVQDRSTNNTICWFTNEIIAKMKINPFSIVMFVAKLSKKWITWKITDWAIFPTIFKNVTNWKDFW